MGIPVYIISFNAPTYLRNTINQLRSEQLKVPSEDIVVVDNASDYPPLLAYYEELESQGVRIIRVGHNGGHLVLYEEALWATLPDVFALTDPDLQFNPSMPSTFRNDLASLSEKLSIYKAGLALDLEDRARFYDVDPSADQTGDSSAIYRHESQFWTAPNDPGSVHPFNEPCYAADIDTTFAVYNKKFLSGDRYGSDHFRAVRAGGSFTCKHLPWYKTDGTTLSSLIFQDNAKRIKTSVNVATPATSETLWYQSKVLPGVSHYTSHAAAVTNNLVGDDKAQKVARKGDSWGFFIDKKTQNSYWWPTYFEVWENETFRIIKKHTTSKRGPTVFCDIGAWIGTTSLLTAHLVDRIVAVEADVSAQREFIENVKVNQLSHKVRLDGRAIFSHDNHFVTFGPGSDGKLNSSMSKIHTGHGDRTTTQDYQVATISFKSLCDQYKIPLNNNETGENVFIKCDIEGGEEFILADLLSTFLENGSVGALYVSMHYDWWTRRNLEEILNKCYANSFIQGGTNISCEAESGEPLHSVNDIVRYVESKPFGSVLWYRQ